MAILLFHIRCLLLLFILIQSVSLYRIQPSDDNRSDLSFNEDMISPIQNKNIGYEDDEDIALTNSDKWNQKLKRFVSSFRMPLPQRRSNRQHWNPLVAAYKRCGELVLREERESCFKDAVQMLFVHKLRK